MSQSSSSNADQTADSAGKCPFPGHVVTHAVFVQDFVAAWTKAMNLDRIDLARRLGCGSPGSRQAFSPARFTVASRALAAINVAPDTRLNTLARPCTRSHGARRAANPA